MAEEARGNSHEQSHGASGTWEAQQREGKGTGGELGNRGEVSRSAVAESCQEVPGNQMASETILRRISSRSA